MVSVTDTLIYVNESGKRMKTLLVTGGAGFIGGNFVLGLVESGFNVVNLDALTYAGNLDTLSSLEDNDLHHFVKGDIADQTLVSDLLNKYQPDAIVNFAAESHVDRSIEGPSEFIQTNVVGTLAMLEASLKYWRAMTEQQQKDFRFLHVSTDEVYGSLGDTGLFREDTPYAPNSPYAASKASSDHLVRAYHHTYGLPVLTTNCSNNYGPYQFPEKLIPLVIAKALAGEKIPVYGDGSNIRDWLYVTDHCNAIATVLRTGTPGEVYNVGGNAERNNLDVVHTICDILDEIKGLDGSRPRRELIEFVTDRPGHDQRYAIDASKLKRELGWEPAMSFDQGMRQTVEWYLANQGWVSRVLDGSYQGERLGISD